MYLYWNESGLRGGTCWTGIPNGNLDQHISQTQHIFPKEVETPGKIKLVNVEFYTMKEMQYYIGALRDTLSKRWYCLLAQLYLMRWKVVPYTDGLLLPLEAWQGQMETYKMRAVRLRETPWDSTMDWTNS